MLGPDAYALTKLTPPISSLFSRRYFLALSGRPDFKIDFVLLPTTTSGESANGFVIK